MANGTDSIERIAADILIASLSQASAASTADLLNKPERITEVYKAVHETVKEAQEKRQEG